MKFSLRDLLLSFAWVGLLLTGLSLINYGLHEAPVNSGLTELLLGIGIVSGAFGIVVGIWLASGGGTLLTAVFAIVGFAAGAILVPAVLYRGLVFVAAGVF